MLLNCTRLRPAYTPLMASQIPRAALRISYNTPSLQHSILRQPLQLLRRSYHHLYNVRPPATAPLRQLTGAPGIGLRTSARLLTIRRCLKTAADTKAVAKRPKRTVFKLAKSDFGRLLRLIKSEKWTLLGGLLCLTISSCITMSVPYFMGKVIDVVFNKDGVDEAAMVALREYSLALFLIFIIGGVANGARVYSFGTAALRIVRKLRSDLYRTMLKQEVGWFDTRGTGELMNRLSNDTYFVGNSLSQNVSDGLRSLVMILAGSTMMVYTSPKLALVSALVVPAVGSLAIFYGRYVRRITRMELDKYADLMKNAEERLANIRTVKLFCREHKEGDQYDKELNEAIKIGYRETKVRSVFFGVTGFSGNLIIISVLYYGGTLVMAQELTIGTMTSFMLYAGYVAVAMNGMSNFYTQLNRGVGASDRIWEIFDRRYDIPIDAGILPPTAPAGLVDFKDVTFSYPSRLHSTVLSNLTLRLSPNQTTALVGRSGSGKSTLSTLLMRLYDPQEGAVLLDGVDIRQINPQWLRRNMGVVCQEPVLFSGSIRSNILYGLNPDELPDEKRLQKVVEDSNVIEFSSRLPNGLDTIVGQRGILLSGGQKQRVAIARAMIKNPTILVLDEATSALDSVSEQLVQNALENVVKGRTVLTIAHRLSTIYKADKIAVLDGGRVVEQGNYDELMGKPDGVFKELVYKQAFREEDNQQTTLENI